ncbi:MAG TPA: cation transporter, partial [Ruminococcus flavefaciens]|nr:cation transporter [Ruminococcus flavefaciens]
AAGVFIKLFGWELNPMFGAAAMSLSSFCVVTNALRLNLFDIRSTKRDKALKNSISSLDINDSDENGSVITVKVKSMMCEHCEKRVREALEALPAVTSADVSHEKGTAVVHSSEDIPTVKLKKAIEDAGYKYVGVK